MKKLSSIITQGIYALLFCSACFYSCSQGNSQCSKYEITQQETAFLSAYNKGDIAVFKNDTTSVLDTLHVTDKSYGSNHYEACNKTVNTPLNAFFAFSHLYGCQIQIIHNVTPKIIYSNYIQFGLNGSLQSMTINGTLYNDVFVTYIDSTTIPLSDRNKLPWKINYSKSKGFIRFYMLSGQTWSKL